MKTRPEKVSYKTNARVFFGWRGLWTLFWGFGLWLGAGPGAWGSDITPGYTFAPAEQNITHTKLNSLVGSATISPTFYTGQPATVTLSPNDVFCVYSTAGGGFRRCTLSGFFGLAITNLSYDLTVSNGCLVQEWNPGLQTMSVCGPTNLWLAGLSTTNLPAKTTVGSGDLIMVWDNGAQTHKAMTLDAVVSGAGTSTFPTVPTDTDLFLGNHGGVLVKMTGGQVANYVSNFLFNATFVHEEGFPNSVLAVNHNLGHTPQFVRWVCVNTSAELGCIFGDEIDLNGVTFGGTTNFTCGANSTQVWAAPPTSGTGGVYRSFGKNGSFGTFTTTRWDIKVYAQ